jgi:hypothetical protein
MTIVIFEPFHIISRIANSPLAPIKLRLARSLPLASTLQPAAGVIESRAVKGVDFLFFRIVSYRDSNFNRESYKNPCDHHYLLGSWSRPKLDLFPSGCGLGRAQDISKPGD